jgi:hypothetical protein
MRYTSWTAAAKKCYDFKQFLTAALVIPDIFKAAKRIGVLICCIVVTLNFAASDAQ